MNPKSNLKVICYCFHALLRWLCYLKQPNTASLQLWALSLRQLITCCYGVGLHTELLNIVYQKPSNTFHSPAQERQPHPHRCQHKSLKWVFELIIIAKNTLVLTPCSICTTTIQAVMPSVNGSRVLYWRLESVTTQIRVSELPIQYIVLHTLLGSHLPYKFRYNWYFQSNHTITNLLGVPSLDLGRQGPRSKK